MRSSFTLDDVDLVYRHGPVRGKDFTWPSKLDASTATLTITLLDGTTETIDKSGNWAIFRMLTNSGLTRGRGEDEFVFGLEKNKIKATFRLKAASVANPFNLEIYSNFRCPPAL
jgi:type VI secretion system protein ImpL